MTALCRTTYWLTHHSLILRDLSMIFLWQITLPWDYLCPKFQLDLMLFHPWTSLVLQWFSTYSYSTRWHKSWFSYSYVSQLSLYRLLKRADLYSLPLSSYWAYSFLYLLLASTLVVTNNNKLCNQMSWKNIKKIILAILIDICSFIRTFLKLLIDRGQTSVIPQY